MAAIASLVLSLLLLLAILVFAMAQVGEIVARHKPQIMLDAVQEELLSTAQASETPDPDPDPDPAPVKAPVQPRAKPPVNDPAPAVSAAASQDAKGAAAPAPLQPPAKVRAQPSFQDIRLVFEAGVSDLGGQEAQEFQEALAQLPGSPDSQWVISAEVLETDSVNDKNTYRLMLQIRKHMVSAGIPTSRIDMRLQKTKTAPAGSERGEIIIMVRPLVPLLLEGGRP